MLYSLQTTNIHIMVFISFVCNIFQLYELCKRPLELYSVTGCGLDGWIRFLVEEEIFLFTIAPRQALGPTPSHI